MWWYSNEGIPEGSIINIIEDVDFPDGSYYKALMKKHESENKVSFIFRLLNMNDNNQK